MFKWFKRLFCEHSYVYDRSYLEKENDGHWHIRHQWKCRKCGKVKK